MSQKFVCFVVGAAIGMYLGYEKEEEICDMCHKSKRLKRKFMKKAQHMQDYFE